MEQIRSKKAKELLRKLCALMLACALVLGCAPSFAYAESWVSGIDLDVLATVVEESNASIEIGDEVEADDASSDSDEVSVLSGSTTSTYATTDYSSRVFPIQVSAAVDFDAMWSVVDLVNAQRRAAGLGELTFNSDLLYSAILRAAELTLLFSHTRPDGTNALSLLPSWALLRGENIAMGWPTASSVMTGWMNSSGHRENILNSNFTDIGVGCVIYNGTSYWVQLFAGGTGGTELSRTAYTGTRALTAYVYVPFEDTTCGSYSMSDVMIVYNDCEYTGSAVEPEMEVYLVADNGYMLQLVEGHDYVVTYENNVEMGTGTATITAAADAGVSGANPTLSGSTKLEFSIYDAKWPRLAGSDRYLTMASIVSETSNLTSSDSVVLASGEKYPDALAASSLAGVLNCPVILTKGDEITFGTYLALANTNATHVYIMGGKNTISEDVVEAIEALGYTTERVAGESRVETAVEIWNEASDLGLTSDTCIITKGSSYADALSIASYAYASETPIFLLDDNSSLTDATVEAIKAGSFTQVIVLGADTSISDSELASKLPGLTVLRLGGEDRYETSELIVQWSTGEMADAVFQPSVTLSYDGIGVACGDNFPDALAASALLGITNSPLLLVPSSSTSISSETRQRIERVIGEHASVITHGWVFGGSSSVSDAVYRLLVQESIS